ncbi:RNA-binding S4 domain-containing protein [Fructobacillus evanidus]|uniref:RQC P-site tRNA stabilizing factor n=1 Tax=Fructobacillus evanidus TaxID=3064281 RepID=A0ABN9YQZ1_9LACO|nr:Ribosomal 50S subunit-recycling heat shock protein [Fructobacillus sp. LMG 32999]CAK1234663.1 Ribosomal 50S subunit-recycling heat shock protein [Fructobacillus sp. LMG 32999]CAK1235048.1 Ribosomal 50S subunit-recycling heat shock protein [Fructobacillus sp. LMG 32999]CAK1235368.1 Ribosomal 50S subunit-recycling heat shock protein [Fructobacillus sp. LMG 32999]CAK1238666.1 Ribosomal 50S subunit-recycling heat shock protein [Fructobacillus sp. LMG 32999]
MRIDKFLKLSRIIKRRAVAKDLADQGRIEINDKRAKSAANVSTNDLITIHFGNKTLVVKVLKLAEIVKKDEAQDMYEVVSESYEQDDKED